MGIDVHVACRCKPGIEPPSPSWGLEGQMVRSDSIGSEIDGATHELSSMTRYYGKHYERGPWPTIAAYLLELLADRGIEKVWYGGDGEFFEEVDLQWLTQMNLHYIDNCERPYRQDEPRVERTAIVQII